MSKNTYSAKVLFQHILVCLKQVKFVLFSSTEVMLFKLGGRAALAFSWSLGCFEYNSMN